VNVSQDRLREDIENTGAFGALDVDGRGRTVPPGSTANRRAREYLVDRLDDADLEVRVDPVGNVAGRWVPETADPDAAPVAAGSHLDSVPAGGIFDGPLGVYAALESVRAMKDAGARPERPVEVVSFTAEEGGTFGQGLLGSSVAVGEYPLDEALALTDSNGRTLERALEEIGFRGDAALDVANWDGWIELHVEQSRRLEEAGVPVGVVTSISGITRCDVTIRGEANHSGSTSMADRTDALAAASELVLAVERATGEVVASDSDTAVGTVGRLDVDPNAVNVVPGAVELAVDVRDVARESTEEIVRRVRRTLARLEADRGVETTLERDLDLEPTPMSERIRRTAHAAGEAADVPTMDLHSGAAHDTMNVARSTDAALLFAPSRGGYSHSPKEWTDWADCAAATRVVAETLADLAGA
jgi:N-carbamoyl-L-amino-acid hydrolase